MKRIGLLTQDAKTYYEMLRVLRDRELKFISLEFGEPMPSNVGVVISTLEERDSVPFDFVVIESDPEAAVSMALKTLSGDRDINDLMIGIDPGTKPGVAAVGDGVVLDKLQAKSPEAVGDIVDRIIREHPSAKLKIRIGNGDRINRNRIFNRLWDDGHPVEIVDETNTTPRSRTPDEDAAVEIALTAGYRPDRRQRIEPCPGEIRNIQRLSRLESDGAITVSKNIAARVAGGHISLTEAIALQKNGDK